MRQSDLTTDYASLYRAWRQFRKGKKPSQPIDKFAYNLEGNLLKLSRDLTNGNYRHGGYRAITVHEKKRRDLSVADVRDRIVHRLLYDYLEVIFDNSFDPDLWSCRKGKGLHACLRRTQNLIRKYSYSYVWRADIIKFFDSTNHDVLLDCLRRKIGHNNIAMDLCKEVISSHNINRTGVPIGNLTSQIFANIYLNELDRFVRHGIKPQAYVRYGDDFIIFCSTRRKIFHIREQTESFLKENLYLSINPKNDVVIPASAGLKFLGHGVSANFIRVDKHTAKRSLSRVNWRNASSYQSLALSNETRDQLGWTLLEKYVDIL